MSVRGGSTPSDEEPTHSHFRHRLLRRTGRVRPVVLGLPRPRLRLVRRPRRPAPARARRPVGLACGGTRDHLAPRGVGLWALQPWARTFAIVVAGVSLFEAILA